MARTFESEPESVVAGVCSICGRPVQVRFAGTGDAEMDAILARAAARVQHDGCLEAERRRSADAALAKETASRASAWERLCDPFYRDSDKWIAGSPRKRGLNLVAVRLAIRWEFGATGLLLRGRASGTGKTTAGWIVSKHEHTAGRFVVATTHVRLSEAATAAAREGTGKWERLVRRADLLFVDDLGKSRFRGVNGEGRAAEEFLFDLVDGRIAAGLPTVFTTNIRTGDELAGMMSQDRGEPFVRRLRDHFQIVDFDRKEAE